MQLTNLSIILSFVWAAVVFWDDASRRMMVGAYAGVVVYISVHLQILLLAVPLIVLTTAVLYLLACDPLPPSEVKVRETSAASEPVAAAP